MRNFAVRIAVYYAAFAALWIIGSDRVAEILFPHPEDIARIQTVKGWAFVGVTAVLLWMLLRRELKRRTKVEDQLKESETQLRSLLEGVSVGIGMETPDGRTIRANPGLAHMLGYSPEEIQDMRFTEYTHPEHAEIDARLFDEMVQGKRMNYQLEKRYVRKDGQIVWGRVTRSVVTDARGKPLYCLGMLEDITERKRAEMGWRESEERFSKAFHASPVPMTISEIDDGRILDMNAEWLAMTGYSREEALGKTSAELGRWPDMGQRKRIVEQLSRDGRVRAFETTILNTADEERTVVVEAETIELDGERRLLLVFHDITERKQMETDLIEARKLEAIGRLAGGIAHDFNNLLQVVHSSIDVAKRTLEDDSKVQPFLNHALQATQRGAKLTHQLLSFSRAQHLHPTIVAPGPAIRDLLELIQHALGDGIEVETEIEDDAPACKVDLSALENAVLNIALNARAAMADGGRLSVRVRRTRLKKSLKTEHGLLPAGDYADISLTDTGCGMAPEVVEHAFDPFFTTREVGQGSGLGLSMVYGFAAQSGGHAELRSAPGRGTTICLLLPAAGEKGEIS